jgi:hypothetical protein
MVQHNKRQSQRRSTNHRLRIDTNHHMSLGTPRPRSATNHVPDQDDRPPLQQEVGPSIGPSIRPLSSEILRPQSDTQNRATQTTPTLPPVQSVGEQSSIHGSMASTDADPPSRQVYTGRDSPVSLFPADQEHVSAFAPERSVAELRFPVPQVLFPNNDSMNQLLQGFQAMFDKHEHDRHDDLIDRQRFETNIQDMV